MNQKPKILIIEDDPVVLALHTSAVEDEFSVITSEDAKTAWDIFCKSEDINVVIMDIQLPDMNGLELADKMYSFQPDTRIIFISGMMNEIHSLETLKTDFYCLLKPIVPSYVTLTAKLALSDWNKIKRYGNIKSSAVELSIDKSILIVDDDPIILENHVASLDGFLNVLQASDGLEAWNLYNNEIGNVAVVVTDIEMPGMDGKTLIKKIRSVSKETQIIAITGILDDDLSEVLYQLDVKCLPKPIHPIFVRIGVYSALRRYWQYSRD